MILKKIVHKAAQAFRLAQAADKKLSTDIAAALDAKAEQLREYEKSFEPEPPEPDPLLEASTALAQAGFSAAAATYALRRFAESLKPEPLSHLTNNWRKMHGLPMHRKPASFRRRRRCLDGRKGMEPGGTDPARRINRNISARHGSQEAEPVGKCGLS